MYMILMAYGKEYDYNYCIDGVAILSRKTRNLLEYYKIHTRRQSVGVRYDWRLDADRTIKYRIGDSNYIL